MNDLENAVWRKSTRSGGTGGDCVEVATTADMVGVRDSKDPEGPVLVFTPDAWRTFVDAVKEGLFG